MFVPIKVASLAVLLVVSTQAFSADETASTILEPDNIQFASDAEMNEIHAGRRLELTPEEREVFKTEWASMSNSPAYEKLSKVGQLKFLKQSIKRDIVDRRWLANPPVGTRPEGVLQECLTIDGSLNLPNLPVGWVK